jgi:hypothetical protein
MVVVSPARAPIEVGYRELIEGRPSEAIAQIEADRRLRDDPVARINAGTAHARLGHIELAKQNFRAAMRSDERYDVVLHDGRFMDSRAAARLAVQARRASLAPRIRRRFDCQGADLFRKTEHRRRCGLL